MECKLRSILVCSIYPTYFILTTWNVNSAPGAPSSHLSPCFILTMWNVNQQYNILKNSSPFGFILTMWNVNQKCPAELKIEELALY